MVQLNVTSGPIAAAAPSLNVYKKVAVIRFPSDSLTYEDGEGNQKSVSIQELGDAISTAVSVAFVLIDLRCLFLIYIPILYRHLFTPLN
jgi:hypothetical protein